MNLKTVGMIGWICLAIDAILVLALFVSKNVGDDAAGRGMATAFGIALAPILLVTGGILWWATRSGSRAGVIAGAMLAGLPFILLGARFVTGFAGTVDRAVSESRRGKFHDPVLTRIAAAIKAGDSTAVRTLLAGSHPDFGERDSFDRTLLGVAVDGATAMGAGPGQRAMVGVLLAAGVPYTADATKRGGDWVSEWACSYGDAHNAMLEAALLHGANPDADERYGNHPMIFCYNMTLPKIRLLVQHGADVQRRSRRPDRMDWSVLMNAIYLREWEWALYFLEQGVPAGHRAPDGNDALSILRLRVAEDPASATGESYARLRELLERPRSTAGR
jgi:hypothetical protein